MELDDLKKSWKKINEVSKPISKEELKKIIKKKSKSTFDNLRRNMFLEIGMLVLSSVGLMLFFFSIGKEANNSVMFAFFGFISLLLLGYLFFGYSLYKSSRTRSLGNFDVLYQLKKQAKSLQNNIKWYRIIHLLFYFPTIIVGLYLGSNGDSFQILGKNTYLIGLSLLFFPFYYFIIQLWIREFYQKYLDEINQLVDELSA